ncbi:hypothetical protein C7212DRAFT_298474 [Tuber magnatum]|uniref:Stress response protein NST1 n=1 Tax=Tuber magnatum TaxID=42249 RepID=A0A317SJX1_9PEZI|nr:hypothetical protein C7212DRAFT_298474 [Tuber magnatum]
MMEQLAERRMQREEEANAVATGHTLNMSVDQGHIPHTHTQPQEYEDEEEYEEDEGDEEEYEEEDEEDEPDSMTEEQRMEEGRRMFQIFAARMFEQRVLTAYREKVARERQDKLLEELDEEAQLRIQREEKKAKEKERKREKKRLQKLAKEEERLKKEAEKAAEEDRLRAIEEKKAEENRKRKEEQRLKRDAEKKAAEEERRKKEEERKKRLEEEREREAERERKRKEHQERERRKREEAAKKAKEEKEARDREAREKRERDERERKEKARKKEAADRENARKEEEERSKAEALAAATAAAKRPPPVSVPALIPQVSQHPPGSFSSPHLSIATPALPKQPIGHLPARPRNASQQSSIQGSVASSPKTPQVVPRMGSSVSPSTPVLQHNIPGPIIPPNKAFQFPSHIPHMAPASPLPHHIAPPPGVPPPEGFPISPVGVNGPMSPFLPGLQRGPPFPNGIPMYSPAQMPLSAASQYRRFATPNGMQMQVPATPGMRSLPQQGRGIFMGEIAPGIPPQLPPGVPLIAPGSPFMGNRAEPVPIPGNHPHSRAPSGSFDTIQRPAPIQRPASVALPKNLDDNHSSVDELSNVMGSRALLEDDGEGHLTENQSPNRRTSGVGFSPLPTRAVPFFDSRVDGLNVPVPSWANPPPPGTIPTSLPNTWANGAGWSDTDAARSTFNRRRINRVDHIRALACKKCRELGGENNNFVEVSTLLRAMEQVSHPDMQILMKDLAEILDIEGDELNGGGILAVTHDTDGRTLVRFEGGELLSDGTPLHQAPGAPASSGFHGTPGEIGSPSVGNASPFKPVPPPGMMVSPSPSGL